ncbi:immunoglobulin heavy chain, partial [Arapaima gigas]
MIFLHLLFVSFLPYSHGITLTSSVPQIKSPGESVKVSCQVSG